MILRISNRCKSKYPVLLFLFWTAAVLFSLYFVSPNFALADSIFCNNRPTCGGTYGECFSGGTSLCNCGSLLTASCVADSPVLCGSWQCTEGERCICGGCTITGDSCTLTSSPNACGQTQTCTGIYDSNCICVGTCDPPPNPAGYGSSCTLTSSPNACGQTQTCTGTIDCSGSCSGTCDPPPNPPGYGSSCSDGNPCTSGETIQCDGSCAGGTVSGTHLSCVGTSCQSVSNTTTSCTDTCSSNADCSACVPDVGQSCNDGNPCTSGETIQCDGSCAGGTVSGTHLSCVGTTCTSVANTTSACSDICTSNLDCGATPTPTPTPTSTFTPTPTPTPTPISSTTADIKANGSDGPISITYNTSAQISWTSTNTTSCSVTKNGSPFSSGTSNIGISSGYLTSNTTFTLSCSGPSGTASDTVEIRILTVSLSASPNSGTAPLNNVSLTATVSGTSSGTYRYFFDCTNDGVNELDTGDISSNPFTASNLCNYSSSGTYTAKVTVWHNYGTATATTTVVTATNQPPTVSNVTIIEPDYCTSGPAAYVNWTYSDPEGDPQSAYQVQVDDIGSAWNPPYVFDCLCQNGTFSGSACPLSGACDGSSTSIFVNGLNFNTTYKARVKVWDTP